MLKILVIFMWIEEHSPSLSTTHLYSYMYDIISLSLSMCVCYIHSFSIFFFNRVWTIVYLCVQVLHTHIYVIIIIIILDLCSILYTYISPYCSVLHSTMSKAFYVWTVQILRALFVCLFWHTNYNPFFVRCFFPFFGCVCALVFCCFLKNEWSHNYVSFRFRFRFLRVWMCVLVCECTQVSCIAHFEIVFSITLVAWLTLLASYLRHGIHC